MRHIWICLIDGVIVRSGPIQPADTMPLLMERLMRIYPHMQADSLKVVREDGAIFDNELWFASPSPNDPNRTDVDDILASVGVVEGHLGVKIYHGKNPEEILEQEANTFPEAITEEMDFGIFNFAGDQLVSIEDVILLLNHKNPPELEPRNNNNNNRDPRRGRSRRPMRGRGGRRRGKDYQTDPANPQSAPAPVGPAEIPSTAETDSQAPEGENEFDDADEGMEDTHEGQDQEPHFEEDASPEEEPHAHSQSEHEFHPEPEPKTRQPSSPDFPEPSPDKTGSNSSQTPS